MAELGNTRRGAGRGTAKGVYTMKRILAMLSTLVAVFLAAGAGSKW